MQGRIKMEKKLNVNFEDEVECEGFLKFCDVFKKMEVQYIICSPPLAFEAIYHFLCVFFLTILTFEVVTK
jgi:hypothetical protein